MEQIISKPKNTNFFFKQEKHACSSDGARHISCVYYSPEKKEEKRQTVKVSF